MKRISGFLLAAIFIFCSISFVSAADFLPEDEGEEGQQTTQSINLAYLKPVTASSQRDNFVFVANAVNDGNLIQRWEPGEMPCWIMIDLEKSVYFDEMRIYTIGSADDYRISGSDDGENWFKITDHTIGGVILSGDFTLSLSVSATYRYVKLEVNKSDMGQDFGIYEWEIRAPAESTGDTGSDATDPSDSSGAEDEGPALLFYLYPRDTAQNREKIRHLARLGIVEGFEDETFRGNRKVSRGEFVKSTVRLLNLAVTPPADIPFEDVPKAHGYFSYIGTAASHGILLGDGSGYFRPDDPISVSEAVKIIVEALGYKALAVHKGGYPNGYFTTANELKLLAGFPKEGSITRANLVNLMYQAMNTKMTVISSLVGEDAIFAREKTVLEQCFEIYKDIGIVYTDGHTSFEGGSAPGNMITINGKEYSADTYFPEIYIGNRVEFYYKDGVILSAEKYRDTVITEIDKEDIEALSDTEVRFNQEEKTKRISFSGGLTIIYNGSVLSSYSARTLMPDYGVIRCMDWNGDGICEVLYIDDALQMKAGVVSDDTVTDADNPEFRLKIKGDSRYMVFQNGKQIEMPTADSILTVFADRYTVKNGVKLPDTKALNVCRIEVSNKTINGRIESVIKDEKKILINGVVYRYMPELEAKLIPGLTLRFYVDFFGRICRAGDSDSFDNYVYFMGVSSPSGLHAPQFKIFDQEKTDTVHLESRVRINGSAATDIRAALQKAGLVDSSGNSVPQLIKIKKNLEGKISSVNTAVAGTDFEPGIGSKDMQMMFFRAAGAGYSFFYFMLEEGATIFEVPKEPETARDKDYKMCEVTDLVHRRNYYVQAYNLNHMQVSNLIVVYKPGAEQMGTSVSQPLSVLTGVKTALNEDGEEEPLFEYYQNGTPSTKFAAIEKVKALLLNHSPGDIVLLAFDNDEKIAGVQDIFLRKTGTMMKVGNQNNANSYLLPALGKVLKADNNRFILDRSAGLPAGDVTAHRLLPYYAGSAICLIFDCERNQLSRGTVSEVLSAGEDDAIFVRGSFSAPREMILYKGYYRQEGM